MSYIVPRNKPDRCTNCPFMDRITYDCMLMYGNDYSDFESQYEHCPLVELPPHGRLGDLDKLEEQFKRAIETYIPKDPTRHMDVDISNRCHAWCNGLTVIQDAPTVIEGSET